ncbi:hypothetical protein AB6E88_08245 [Providencia hangzhouensis]
MSRPPHDVTVQARILELLTHAPPECGVALIFITHVFRSLTKLAPRCRHAAGEIVETGETQTVLRQPRHPYTQRLIASVPESGEGRGFFKQLNNFMVISPMVNDGHWLRRFNERSDPG